MIGHFAEANWELKRNTVTWFLLKFKTDDLKLDKMMTWALEKKENDSVYQYISYTYTLEVIFFCYPDVKNLRRKNPAKHNKPPTKDKPARQLLVYSLISMTF